jgi:peptidoglycan hydrolase CwlO-like protein
MELLFIFITTSVTGAVFTIVALLLVAAIIGYFSAWLYAKSVYTPVIKKLEEEKAALIREVAALKEENGKLNGKVDKLNDKVAKLEEEVASKEKEIKKLTKDKK